MITTIFSLIIIYPSELHQTVCKKRTLATIGTHDLSSVQEPFFYGGQAPRNIHFIPLKEDEEFTGPELLQHFARINDTTMSKYFNMIKQEILWPILADSDQKVMSLPPVVNSKYSQITIDTHDIVVEVTSSTSVAMVKEVLNHLLTQFGQQLRGRSRNATLIVEQVEVRSKEDSHLRMKYPLQRDLEEICNENKGITNTGTNNNNNNNK